VSTALTELNFLDTEAICQCLSKCDFRFEDLADPCKKVAVFLIIPSEKLEIYNRYTRLMMSVAINTISHIGGNPDKPIDLYIDEAGTIGHLSILSQGVALMRERGMCFWTVFQSLSQLQRDYKTDWKNFIGNSNPIFLLDVMDSDEAEYFSKMMGETTFELKNGQEYSQNVGDLPYMLQKRFNCHYNGMVGEKISSTSPRRLMTPDELRRLPEHLGIVITDGHPAVFVKAKCYEAEPFCNVVQNNHIR
jgi:type IV secretion system protein VirD4